MPVDPPESRPSESRPSLATAMLGVSAMVAAAVGVIALTVVASGDGDGGGATAVAAEATAAVELSEFAITPGAIAVDPSGDLQVTNIGSLEHNLVVVGEDVRTPDLGTGGAANLSVANLAPGDYEVICDIPGHADAGMRGTLTVSADGAPAAGGGGGGGHEGHSAMDYQKMTDDMLATMNAFPAETAGAGNVELEPTEVLADGTLVFDLTMELADWEVEPGKVVEAWTFNGMVPGPLIRVDVGQPVHLRVQNDLPLATDVHLHGLRLENRFDGVAPYTQDLIEPGETFTYEFIQEHPAVAMYHPHAHGHMLLPNGMFGGIVVGDVPLPLDRTVAYQHIPADVEIAQEIPMVLNDSGVIGYSLNGKSFPATEPYTASVGDWILIHYWNEGNQIHPMHLHQFGQTVVAKDGFPVDAPYTVDTLNVAPGERYTVLVHADTPGTWVWHCHILPHVERESGMFGMVTALIVE